ncbi:MAG: carboxylesterase family protein [Deltaproteobacteria bacterium]|jgi:para-nitrobenzyl esterase|nr:carboxylesterase family protein [Deltaproteobacteria bacterium]
MMASVTVETSAGPVAGSASGGIAVFKGIPYAEAPAGALRFAPPEPRRPWREPRDCTAFGPMAHQAFRKGDIMAPPAGTAAMSEDCLSVNVWAPEDALGGGALPVYVFIHGGGFAAGSASQPLFGAFPPGGAPRPLYDGAAFARRGVVLVTLNYRLGAPGFLCLEAIAARHGVSPGNRGLLDQLEALRWVAREIAAFGGDPGAVTLGGESAGAVCASALAVSPPARGLFRGAVMQSGTVLSLPGFPVAKGDPETACALGEAFLRLLGLPRGAAGLAALERADPAVLARLTALDFDFRRPCPLAFSPVADGTVVPADPHAALARGGLNCRRILVGFNRDEGSLFLPRETAQGTLATMEHCFLGPAGLAAFAAACPPGPGDGRAPWRRTRRALAYALFTAGARRFADLASRSATVYAYRFDHAPPLARLAGLGACHALELPFVFGSHRDPGLLSGRGSARLASLMNSLWASFAAAGGEGRGRPAAAGPPPPLEGGTGGAGFSWPAYDERGLAAAVFARVSRAARLPDAEGLAVMAEAFFGAIPGRTGRAGPSG